MRPFLQFNTCPLGEKKNPVPVATCACTKQEVIAANRTATNLIIWTLWWGGKWVSTPYLRPYHTRDAPYPQWRWHGCGRQVHIHILGWHQPRSRISRLAIPACGITPGIRKNKNSFDTTSLKSRNKLEGYPRPNFSRRILTVGYL